MLRRDDMFEDEEAEYVVVVNDEEQYSIWPAARPLPPGWRNGGKSGKRKECLAFIDETWTDMRPLSLRRFMDAHSQQ
jgi:MbtH protein